MGGTELVTGKGESCISHYYSCCGRLKPPTHCPKHASSSSPLSAMGEHAILGFSSSFLCPHLLGAWGCLWRLCGSPVDALHGPTSPSGSPGKWEPITFFSRNSSLAIIATGQLWQGAILPPAQLRTHTSHGGQRHPLMKAWPLC